MLTLVSFVWHEQPFLSLFFSPLSCDVSKQLYSLDFLIVLYTISIDQVLLFFSVLTSFTVDHTFCYYGMHYFSSFHLKRGLLLSVAQDIWKEKRLAKMLYRIYLVIT